jgi:CheY-like chemotaxis protein
MQAQLSTREYEELNSRIYMNTSEAKSGKTILLREDTAQVVKRLKDLLRREVQRVLERGAGPEAVAQAVHALQGNYSPSKTREVGNTPFVHQSVTNQLQVVTVAVSIIRGNEGIPNPVLLLMFFVRAGGQWELVAETGEEFDGKSFYIKPLTSPANEEWFLVYGQTFGSPGGYKDLVAYGFNGFGARIIARMLNIRSCNITKIDGDEVFVTYVDQRDAQWREFDLHLKVTPNGFTEISRAPHVFRK